jgi:hypothetical protein
MVDPKRFASGGDARLRRGGEHGLEAELGGVIYPVASFGSDAVQVLDPDTGGPVATLTMQDGKFVLAGQAGQEA